MARFRRAHRGEFFIRENKLCTKVEEVCAVTGIKRLKGIILPEPLKPKVSKDGNWVGLFLRGQFYTSLHIRTDTTVNLELDPADFTTRPLPKRR